MPELNVAEMNVSGGDRAMGLFKKYVGNFKALPWVGLAISLVAVFGLQMSTFLSLGLSLMGSQHRYRYSQIIVDPIEDFTSNFIIMPALFLGPILFSVGCSGLIIRAILRRPRTNPNSGNSRRMIGAFMVGLSFAAVALSLVIFIGAILFGIGFGYEAWKDTLPFPEVIRRVTP